MEYRKVIANSTETFRFRHLLIEKKIDKFERTVHFEDEEWLATDFKSAEIYQSVHWLSRLRLDGIAENGIFELENRSGKQIKTQTVIVKIFKKIIVSAGIKKLGNHIHVNYRVQSREVMIKTIIGNRWLYVHYAQHQIKLIEEVIERDWEKHDRKVTVRYIESWFETMMLANRKTKKLCRRLIWKG